MKIAIFSEFTTDEAVLKILVEGILGEEIEQIAYRKKLQSRGSGVPRDVPVVLRDVYYNSEAEFLVVVRDSDDSPIHKKEHNKRGNKEAERCRLCELQKIVSSELANLSIMPGKENFKVAVGVAVPAIEAWLLCGVESYANEANWVNKQREKGSSTYNDRKLLKTKLYGSEIAPGNVKTARQVEAARRLSNNIEQLEKLFPAGFGSLAAEIRSWKK
ncbi:MAG TPA: hypothetical protein VF644_21695 [Pyrinomonadaceae bacterium]|jgi:hypothetical protein